MKSTIVFWANVDNEESYNALANFIYKRETHKNLTQKELYNITYKYYLRNMIQTEREWARAIMIDRESFGKVQNPEDIKNITEQYEVVYCLNVPVEADKLCRSEIL